MDGMRVEFGECSNVGECRLITHFLSSLGDSRRQESGLLCRLLPVALNGSLKTSRRGYRILPLRSSCLSCTSRTCTRFSRSCTSAPSWTTSATGKCTFHEVFDELLSDRIQQQSICRFPVLRRFGLLGRSLSNIRLVAARSTA